MEIKVTQGHINQGEPNSLTRCAIALAAKNAGLINPHVSVKAIGFRIPENETHWNMVSLPPVACDFIAAGLEKKKVKPFTFELDL